MGVLSGPYETQKDLLLEAYKTYQQHKHGFQEEYKYLEELPQLEPGILERLKTEYDNHTRSRRAARTVEDDMEQVGSALNYLNSVKKNKAN